MATISPTAAVRFSSQAADRYREIGYSAKEGVARSNLAAILRRLGRLDEARREVHRSSECKAEFGHAAEPWKTWDILSDIERDTGNPDAALDARAKAVAAYLAYRRDGGENRSPPGQLALRISELLLADDSATAEALLSEGLAHQDLPDVARSFLQSLLTICQGSRDPALADTEGLDYKMSAEILLLIERLTQQP
ncbi:hypothetical protein [Thiorhodococcus minor]|uniref:Tetratricopeptide repeat protein n=1 Tax=Thiorhodococcus minor TaxID=57489 RepID=A0A6M0JXC9_9GAMM|nr:hypothetical protein [Thiorhodococcus minor]NEV62198.1 hypothetical protein [Thiorhodococcus minor]